MLSDDEIIDRVLGGHTEDFRKLLARHQDGVYRLALSILGRREDAEDAAQEAFVRVFKGLRSYKARGAFRLWIRRIAVNVCLSRLRQRSASENLVDCPDPAAPDWPPVEAQVLKRIAHEDIREAVAELPSHYRTVIALRYQEDMAYGDIAEVLGEPVTTVQMRLFRAKKMLASRLAVVRDELSGTR